MGRGEAPRLTLPTNGAKMLNRIINDLHPIMRPLVQKFEGHLLDEKLLGTQHAEGFRLFEGYRSPERQDELFRSGNGVTRARAWQSAHQYGLAVDFVWWTGERWSWDQSHPWEEMRSIAFMRVDGLIAPLKWDLAHIEHMAWNQLRRVIPRHRD